jgi:hypothetical protein
MRLVDSYVNLMGRHTFDLESDGRARPVNIPASRFLRPYNRKLKFLEPLKIRRILHDMTAAARTNRAYHLWWHPEDFGLDTETNLSQLRCLAEHFRKLQVQYKMRSKTMFEAAGSER